MLAQAPSVNIYEIMNYIYPVNSIYMTVENITEAQMSSKFGGTWEKIKDRFLLASGDTYANGNTGGKATMQLDQTHLPSHRHRLLSASNYSTNCNGLTGYNTTQVGGVANSNGTEVYCDLSASANNALGSNVPYVENTGGDAPFSIMPPYLVVNVFKRKTLWGVN